MENNNNITLRKNILDKIKEILNKLPKSSISENKIQEIKNQLKDIQKNMSEEVK